MRPFLTAQLDFLSVNIQDQLSGTYCETLLLWKEILASKVSKYSNPLI